MPMPMPMPLLERAVHQAVTVATRRCSVPSDLTPITTLGDEQGDAEVADRIWTMVEDLYRSGMHPAIQVCIRYRGEVVVDRAIGHVRGNYPGRRFDRDRAVALTLDTPINLFSAAKAVSGMVVHKLIELGAFALDDRIADHIPEFERHGKGEVTVRHVLTHRAGVASLPGEAFDLDMLADHERVAEVVCDLRPSGAPGGAPAYHAVTGGLIMEMMSQRTTGRSMRDVLATEIKEPLGLRWLDFGVSPDEVHLIAKNVETGLPAGPLIWGFTNRVLGKPWSQVLRMSNDDRFLTSVIPSANVIVTARDAATFYQCLLNGGSIDGTRVFDEETVARAVEPEGDDIAFDRMLAIPVRYSPGFMLGTESFSLYGWNHPAAFGHLGMSNLFTWADPDNELVVALLTTGKPMLGGHLPALVRLIGGLYEVFPPR
jgi:CubicO group peptidase (beta-lactamase class C family)